jgi:hypothetical protein
VRIARCVLLRNSRVVSYRVDRTMTTLERIASTAYCVCKDGGGCIFVGWLVGSAVVCV